MIELYSTNIAVTQNSPIPMNNVSIVKGNTAIHTAPATIQLNKKGIYSITCNAVTTPADAGVVGIQLAKDNILEPGAVSQITAAANSTYPLSFACLVQVKEDNTCCCSTSPTLLQVINTGIDTTYTNFNIIVTKLC